MWCRSHAHSTAPRPRFIWRVRVVSGFVDASSPQPPGREVEAIQQTLGPESIARPFDLHRLSAARLRFPAQTPGGSLVVGNNSITLAPVPLGVNGSEPISLSLRLRRHRGSRSRADHRRFGSIGGTFRTLIIQCANTHTGAWTIDTATAGIQEAVNTLPNGGWSPYQRASRNVYAPTTITTDYMSIRGTGGASTLQANHNTEADFHFSQVWQRHGGPQRLAERPLTASAWWGRQPWLSYGGAGARSTGAENHRQRYLPGVPGSLGQRRLWCPDLRGIHSPQYDRERAAKRHRDPDYRRRGPLHRQ